MKRIKKVVITAAGTGTRLLPYTKENPKEMMPIFAKNGNEIVLKPVLQVIYESIFDFGIKDFCFVVGRGKRSIEDHFLIPNNEENLKNNSSIKSFFSKVMQYLNQNFFVAVIIFYYMQEMMSFFLQIMIIFYD